MGPAPVGSRDSVPTRLPRHSPQQPRGMLSESPCWWHDYLRGKKAPSHSKCFSTELGNACEPQGMWEQEGDRQQERAGSTVLPALHSSCLNPFSWRGEERVCRHPLPLLQILPCPLFVCLSLHSCCRITSHIFQPAEQGWELLSIAWLSNSKMGQGHQATSSLTRLPTCL